MFKNNGSGGTMLLLSVSVFQSFTRSVIWVSFFFFFSLLDNENNITSILLDELNFYFFLTANNPENKAKWAEIRRLERSGHH